MTQDVEKIKEENEKLGDKKKNLDKDGAIVPENCITCRFSRGKGDSLRCCRKPPHSEYGFPFMTESAWCGEYEYDGALR